MYVCICVCLYRDQDIFVWKPLIQPYQYKEQMSDKRGSMISIFLLRFLGSPGDALFNSVFMSSLWVAKNPKIGRFTSAYIQRVSQRMEI